MVAAMAAVVLFSCGGGESKPPELTCSATCTAYRWHFEEGSGGSAEWCSAPLPKGGGVSQCVANSTDMTPPLNCTMMVGQTISTCTGTIKSLDSGREWTVTTTVDPTACAVTVSVDGVGSCSAP